MSWPPDSSVNDFIPEKEFLGEKFHFTYPKVDALVDLIKSKGRGCAVFKRDLKAAYRQLLRVDPGDIHLLGFSWNGKLFFDLTQPQGSRSAAFQCQRSSSAIRHIYRNHHPGYDLVNYLDDFGSAEHWDLAEEAFIYLANLLTQAGLLESVAKQSKPSTIMTFLGIGIDTVKLVLFVTRERMIAIKNALCDWLERKLATKKDIKSLAGVLAFVSTCVPGSRIFLSRIYTQMKVIPRTGKHPLSVGFKLDIDWWLRFIQIYNGVSMMLIEEWSYPDAIVSTDACLVGCGGWFGSKRLYFHTVFPSHIKNRFHSKHHIAQLELLAVVLMCKVWGHLLSGCRLIVYCDNDASVAAINYHRATNSFLQLCSREISFVCASYEFRLRAEHISGVSNRIPDFLSRWSLGSKYKNLFFSEIGADKAFEYFITEDMFEFADNW